MQSLREIRNRFEQRILFFQMLGFVLFLLLFLRLLDLQWLQHEGLLLQAEQNRINVVPVLAARGEIVDRERRGLAVNHVSYHVYIIPERVPDMEKTLARLTALLGWDARHLSQIKRRLKHARRDRPLLVEDRLSWGRIAILAARLHHLAGVDVKAGTRRHYPFGSLTSHLIGYLSLASTDDVNKGMLPIEKAGRSGVEKVFEAHLHGKLGSQYEEIDAIGNRVSVLNRIPPVTGQQIDLALDIDLQQAAARALAGHSGAAVAMDVNSGAVLVLLSRPGMDPNRFISGMESEQWKFLLQNPQHPLLNRATQAAFPPASTFKLITSLAALRHGSPLTRRGTTCQGFVQLADRKLRCWKRRGHGPVDLHRAIVESCDVYFYKLGDQLGMKPLLDEALIWGFGQPTGIALPSEAQGQIPLRARTPSGRERKWFRGETMITAIGQGAISVTPMQMVRFAAALANGGKLLKPQLLAGQPADIISKIDVRPKTLDFIRKAMRDVVATVHGTAHASLARLPWTVAGKTGTAQVVSLSQDEDERKKSHPGRPKDHAWFMGYAPYEKPKIAFAVFVEHGGHGGSAAAPVAAAIIRAMAAKEHS